MHIKLNAYNLNHSNECYHFDMNHLLVLLWFCASVRMEMVNRSSKVETQPKSTFRIERIRIFGDLHFMEAFTHIHEDRCHFDIYVKLKRKLGSNYLIMNINFRVKFEDSEEFLKVFQVKHVDFCSFLSNPSYRHLFISSTRLSGILECPIQVGNYSLLNIDMGIFIQPEGMLKGIYKFFIEIVEVTGEIPKILALQVTTKIL